MNTAHKIWFPAKTVGYGWGMPNCWQGRLVLLTYLLLLGIGGFLILREPKNAGYYFLYMLGLTSVLIFICWLKGEKLNQTEKK